jgi:hypothetical protein
MKKSRITITIDPEIDNWLRPEASFTGKSLSHMVRLCLIEYYQLKPERFSRNNKARTESENAFLVAPERLENR